MRKDLLTMTFRVIVAFAVSLLPYSAKAAITEAKGWFESLYVQWQPVAGATDYNVYLKTSGGEYAKIDKELVRQYPDYFRADAVGLKAGRYSVKVVPVKDGAESAGEAMETSLLDVTAHDRSGFAHVGMPDGIGAYQNDGTLKPGAKVIYVYADNAKTVSTEVVTNSKGTKTKGVGLQNIIYLYQKGYDKTPLDIRIIGTIKKENMDELGSSAEGLQIKGGSDYQDMPITIEGIGTDAAINGFGMLLRSVKGVELSNFAVILCMDDCLSLDTKNSNIWIHNMDFFYGNTGGDSDQAKGDGTVDIKAASKNVTLSYCHFYDSGKASLGGMSNEVTTAYHTYHHNWFDHSDSRHPRVRVQFFHVYNNYYDGNSKYGVGMTSGGSAFVEKNYFRNCKYPMLTSKQGTDAEGEGTFSGEPGGVIKAFDNIITNARKVQYYDGAQTNGKWDAVRVTRRDEAVTAKAYSGGTSYNSDADLAARTTYIENKMDEASDVPAIVRGWLGAGRMGHGDIKWTFNNSKQDENYGVIADMKTMLLQYTSTLVGFADGTKISNGGALKTVDGGDGKGIDQEVNDAYIPSYVAGGGGEIIPPTPEGSNDASCTFAIDGTSISFESSYTHRVPYTAAEAYYVISLTPAEGAKVSNVSGAERQEDGTYTIAAPQCGETATAVFVIVAENGATVRTYTINIAKGVDPSTVPAKDICHFTDKKPSLAGITVTGNYSTSKGSVTYDEVEYSTCVKMESSTSITITPATDSRITLVFDTPAKALKLNGAKQTTDASGQYSFDALGNTTYTLTKGDSINLFLIVIQKSSTTGVESVSLDNASAPEYNIAGQRISNGKKQIVIRNGKKVIKGGL